DGIASVIELTVIALPSVFAIEMVKVTVPPEATKDGLTALAIEGGAAPHELTIDAVAAPIAFGKLDGAPPVKVLTPACVENWLQVTLPELSVAFAASRYRPAMSALEFQ